jgi:hypothetical protein
MISKFEYWGHRLFPMMKFSDVIEKLEKLGDKREVKVSFTSASFEHFFDFYFYPIKTRLCSIE